MSAGNVKPTSAWSEYRSQRFVRGCVPAFRLIPTVVLSFALDTVAFRKDKLPSLAAHGDDYLLFEFASVVG